MAGSGTNRFSYGLYGEIIPPPLVSGIDPDEALKEMVGEATYNDIPVEERKLFYGNAAIYIHQHQLAKVFSGTTGIEGSEGLYQAALNGAKISLRPLGYEQEQYITFAPVFYRLPNGKWRVGVPGQGKTKVLDERNLGEAYLQVREIYVQWAEEEMQREAA